MLRALVERLSFLRRVIYKVGGKIPRVYFQRSLSSACHALQEGIHLSSWLTWHVCREDNIYYMAACQMIIRGCDMCLLKAKATKLLFKQQQQKYYKAVFKLRSSRGENM